MPVTRPEVTRVHGVIDPLLRERAARQRPFIDEVRQRHAARMAHVPMLPDAPIGGDTRLALGRGADQAAIAAEDVRPVG